MGTFLTTSSTTINTCRIFALGLVLLLAACSQKSAAPTSPAPAPESTPPAAQQVDQQAEAMYREGLDAMATKDYPTAMRLFTRFTERYPDKAGAYANLALIEFRSDHPERADELLQKSLQLNPDSAQAHNLKAQIELHNGAIPEALEHYQRAVELDPQYANAHYNLALLYDIYLRDIELALQHYRQYLAHSDEKDETTQDWIRHLESTLTNE